MFSASQYTLSHSRRLSRQYTIVNIWKHRLDLVDSLFQFVVIDFLQSYHTEFYHHGSPKAQIETNFFGGGGEGILDAGTTSIIVSACDGGDARYYIIVLYWGGGPGEQTPQRPWSAFWALNSDIPFELDNYYRSCDYWLLLYCD